MSDVKLSKDAQGILDSLKKLSVLDLAELVKAMEEEFGISAAAPVAVAAAGAPVEAAVEEKSSFDIVLKDCGGNKIAVIKLVREFTGLGLGDAKTLAENGGEIKKGVKKEEADEIKAKFDEAGAAAELV